MQNMPERRTFYQSLAADVRRIIERKLQIEKTKNILKISQKPIDKRNVLCYNNPAERYGPVAQLVRALACHARGRGFEPLPGRQNRYDRIVSVFNLPL